jgi:osmotically-inducible protein OsmY
MLHPPFNRRFGPLAAALLLLVAGGGLRASDQDSRVAYAITSSYNFKTYLIRDDIAVQVSDGVVTLTGLVVQDDDRALAAATVANTAGVRTVINQLQVQGDQPADQSDAWITLKVQAALAYHKHVKALGTEVTTVDGTVTLKGQVDSQGQKDLTTAYALDVQGVKQVDNQQTVTGTPPRRAPIARIDDASITGLIKTSLLFHRSIHALATQVSTRDGVVTLRGEAGTAAEKGLVGKLAEDTQGVKRVNNRMHIQPS